MTPGEILRKALEKETEARDFYGDLANRCSVDFLKEMLIMLQNEEGKHIAIIRKMLAKLNSGQSPI